MRAKFGRDPMAGSKKVTLKFIIGYGFILASYRAEAHLFGTSTLITL